MSIDRSLKSAGNLVKHRNVLSRAERIEKLIADEKFERENGNPIGLPKVANRKVATTGKSSKKDAAEETGDAADIATDGTGNAETSPS